MERRIILVMTIFLLLFSTFLGRLFVFQVVRGEEIARHAVAMRSTEVELREYARGDILDRNLIPMTGQRTNWALYCLPEMIGSAGEQRDDGSFKKGSFNSFMGISEFLAAILQGQTASAIAKKLERAEKNGDSMVQIVSSLTPAQMAAIEQANLPGVAIAPVVKRYREDGFAVHLLGYVKAGTEPRGQTGLETFYDALLSKSKDVQQLVSVRDARGENIPGLMFKLKQQNQNPAVLVTTLDTRIQDIVEKAMNKAIQEGAVVVMDTQSKEILAMASRPAFNPYDIQAAMDNTKQTPLINRAVQGYNPGSLFKIMASIAALEEGTVKTGDVFHCSGAYEFDDGFTIACWKEEGHGTLSFEEAFAMSCNPSFISIGLALGKEKLERQVSKVHLTDQQIVGYRPEAFRSYVSIDGGSRAMANASLGQLGVVLTPVQMCSLLCTVADDGKWSSPVVLRYTQDNQGKKTFPDKMKKQQVMKETTARQVRDLLEKVVTEGTGKNAAIHEAQVTGKTATSQTGRFNEQGEEILNTWFAGFLPADHPRWAIVVMTEKGVSGSESAAPVFREISQGILHYYSVNDFHN